jgi:hypothetical protein
LTARLQAAVLDHILPDGSLIWSDGIRTDRRGLITLPPLDRSARGSRDDDHSSGTGDMSPDDADPYVETDVESDDSDDDDFPVPPPPPWQMPNFIGSVGLDRVFHFRRCHNVSRERTAQRPLRIMRMCQTCANGSLMSEECPVGFSPQDIDGTSQQRAILRHINWAPERGLGRIFNQWRTVFRARQPGMDHAVFGFHVVGAGASR